MSRLADLFVATCIVAVSTSVGMVLFYQLELPSVLAVAIVLALLLLLMLVNFRNLRQQDRVTLDDSVERLTRRLDQVTADLDSMERRLTAIETNGPRRMRQELEPVVAEVEVVGALIRQVVETVADLEAQITGVPAPAVRSSLVATPGATASMPISATAGGGLPKRFAQLGEKGFLDLVRASIDANRIDVHLQPIVTLPQRKIRYYEALTRLRTADGETIYPSDYIPLAERAGIMPSLDNQILIRSLQILKRLTQRTKDVGIFCNMSTASLGDGQFFPEFLKFLGANKELAEELIFEFGQQPLKVLGAIEYEGLRAIQGLGFRFSIDQVSDLRSSFQFLADRGFRYVKISADRILNGGQALASDIHPADLASFFSRFGMDLIVDHIESEAQVVDILDYAVKYGQGFLFSPPRPVKTEIFAANADVPHPKPADAPPIVMPNVPPRPSVVPPRRAEVPVSPAIGDLRQPLSGTAGDLRQALSGTVGEPRLTGVGAAGEPRLTGVGAAGEPRLTGVGAVGEPRLTGAGAAGEPRLTGAGAVGEPRLTGVGAAGEPRLTGAGAAGARRPSAPPSQPAPAAETPPRGNTIAQMIERRSSGA